MNDKDLKQLKEWGVCNIDIDLTKEGVSIFLYDCQGNHMASSGPHHKLLDAVIAVGHNLFGTEIPPF